jgi:diguanylate cyclase (GGDEF)-like protein
MLLLAYYPLRSAYPNAWVAAAFGLFFALLWPLARRSRSAPADSEAASESSGDTGERLGRGIEVLVDLAATAWLVAGSGGLRSPFVWLYALAVVGASVQLSARATFLTAFGALLLHLMHVRFHAPLPVALSLYAAPALTLLACAGLLARRQHAPQAMENLPAEAAPGRTLFRRKRKETLLAERTAELLEKQLEEEYTAHRQLKETYREVARLHREQKARIEILEAAETLFQASARAAVSSGNAYTAYGRLLRIVMDTLEAGGGALWMAQGDMLLLRATEGRLAANLSQDPITGLSALPSSEIRAQCEARYAALMPVAARLPRTQDDAASTLEEAPEQIIGKRVGRVLLENEEEVPTTPFQPRAHLVALFYAPQDDPNETPRLMGALSVCEPRGASRFNQTDQERLHALAAPFARALAHAEERRLQEQKLQETQLRYDLARLTQTATRIETIYQAVAERALQIAACENSALFLLNPERNTLEMRAAVGRPVHLLPHLSFEQGQGVAGWIASKGRPVLLPDLSQTPGLIQTETLPGRIRSFVALPLRAQGALRGALTLSDSHPNVFNPDAVRMLALLADGAAQAISENRQMRLVESVPMLDEATQTYHPHFFEMRLEEEAQRAQRYRQPLTLMLVEIVSASGRPVAEENLLREAAQILMQSVRQSEIVARLEESRFAVLMPQVPVDQALVAAQRVRLRLQNHAFASPGQPTALIPSIGIACLPHHARTPEELLLQANRALQQARAGASPEERSLWSEDALRVPAQNAF